MAFVALILQLSARTPNSLEMLELSAHVAPQQDRKSLACTSQERHRRNRKPHTDQKTFSDPLRRSSGEWPETHVQREIPAKWCRSKIACHWLARHNRDIGGTVSSAWERTRFVKEDRRGSMTTIRKQAIVTIPPTVLPQYLCAPERCPLGQNTTGSVLWTSPFSSRKQAQEPENRKTGAAANHKGKGQGGGDQAPTPSTTKDQNDTRPGTKHTEDDQRTHTPEGQPPGQPGSFSPGGTSASLVPLCCVGNAPRYSASQVLFRCLGNAPAVFPLFSRKKVLPPFRRCFERFLGRRPHRAGYFPVCRVMPGGVRSRLVEGSVLGSSPFAGEALAVLPPLRVPSPRSLRWYFHRSRRHPRRAKSSVNLLTG